MCIFRFVLLSFLCCSVIFFGVSLVLDVLIIPLSLRGTIIEIEKRKRISIILLLRAMIGLIQFVTSCAFGIYLFTYFIYETSDANHTSYFPCDSEYSGYHRLYHVGFYIALMLSQLIDFSGLMCCCYLLSSPRNSILSNMDAAADKKSDDHSLHNESVILDGEMIASSPVTSRRRVRHDKAITNQWALCCKHVMRSIQLCTCNVFGGSQLVQNETAFEVQFYTAVHKRINIIS